MLIAHTNIVNFKDDLEELYTFSDFPIFMGPTDQAREQDSLLTCIGRFREKLGLFN